MKENSIEFAHEIWSKRMSNTANEEKTNHNQVVTLHQVRFIQINYELNTLGSIEFRHN